MRAVCSRIGSAISCDPRAALSGGLICAALLGRRVFVFVALALALGTLLARIRASTLLSTGSVEGEPKLVLSASTKPVGPRRLDDRAFRNPQNNEPLPIRDRQIQGLLDALRGIVVGQREAIEAVIVALIADGHVLIAGTPGLAKTLACRALASAIDGTFARIQCTPDLLPGDISGSQIYDLREQCFHTRLGPIFANVVLVDEVNRAPARAQAGLLEAMGERQVTIGSETHQLPDPFIVLATMNEVDSDGIYPLPAAQLDRFLFKVVMDYPDRAEELEILDRFGAAPPELPRATATRAQLLAWRTAAERIYCAPALKAFIVDIVRATRRLENGSGPRASLALLRASRARALLAGRDFVVPADVCALASAVLRHRLTASTEEQIAELLRAVPLP